MSVSRFHNVWDSIIYTVTVFTRPFNGLF